MNEKPIGSGPYRVTEHALGKYIRFERNADYFKDGPKPQPKIDKLEIRFIPDRQTQIAEMLSGGLDLIMNVPLDQAVQLRDAAAPAGPFRRDHAHQVPATRYRPTGRWSPQFKDERVRRAVLHAIDREGMLKSIVGEGARVIHTVCFPGQFGCTDEGAPRYAYDPGEVEAVAGRGRAGPRVSRSISMPGASATTSRPSSAICARSASRPICASCNMRPRETPCAPARRR